VTPEKSEGWSAKERLLESIFKAGHHTTLQHTHITLLIEGMSRHLIWRLLHSHPYYNSEQISQRYAKMKNDAFVFPANGEKGEWEGFYSENFSLYEGLINELIPVMEGVLPKFKKKEATKKAQEMARYILPVGMSAYLYHTVNVITLLRYISVAQSLPEVQDEALEFAGHVERILLEIDSGLLPLIEEAKKSVVRYPQGTIDRIKKRVGITSQTTQVFDIVEGDEFAINENYGDVLRGSMMVHDGGVLGGFSAYEKVSFACDAQNQRHRRSPAVRSLIEENFQEEYYTPPLFMEHESVKKVYDDAVRKCYDFFEQQQKRIGFSQAIYALPNAHLIELVERNDFSSFHHKAQMRLCYNAQQEIFDVVYEQIKQLQEKKVAQAQSFLPPCAVREQLGIHPICPEGDRFCGVKVWKLDFENFQRII
jgi:thymidylate synthase ThyX